MGYPARAVVRQIASKYADRTWEVVSSVFWAVKSEYVDSHEGYGREERRIAAEVEQGSGAERNGSGGVSSGQTGQHRKWIEVPSNLQHATIDIKMILTCISGLARY